MASTLDLRKVNQFDNKVTRMYKLAFSDEEHQVPIKYLIPQQDSDPIPVTNLIKGWLDQKYNLVDIYTILTETDMGQSLDAEDICMLYLSQRHPSGGNDALGRQIFDEINGLVEQINAVDEAEDVSILNTNRDSMARLIDIWDMLNRLQEWRNQYDASLQRDAEVLQRVITIQEELIQTEPLEHTEPIINTISVEYKVMLKDEAPNEDYGADILNSAIPSFDVPFIQWNNEQGVRHYRIYHGSEEGEDRVPVDMVTPFATMVDRPNTIYLMLWTGSDKTNISHVSYQRCIYYLDENRMEITYPTEIKTPGDGHALSIERIQAAFPELRFVDRREKKIRGVFLIPDFSVDESELHYCLLNNRIKKWEDGTESLIPIFSTYLYIDETVKSLALKDRINIHYKSLQGDGEEATGTGYIRNPASVTVTFTHDTITDIGKEIGLLVNFSAESTETLEQFMQVFSRLLRIYDKIRRGDTFAGDLEAGEMPMLVFDYFGAGEAEDSQTTDEKGTFAINSSKMIELRARAPDLIFKTSRDCQCAQQPIIIDPEVEKEAWINKTFIKNNKEQHREVLGIPPSKDGSQPKYSFVCPDDDLPYPQLKANKGPNKELYPYIPCCGGRRADNVKMWYTEKSDRPKVPKPTRVMTSMKAMEEGVGALPNALTKMLMSRYHDEDDITFSRYGIVRSPSSLLHCILTATKNPTYLRSSSEEKARLVDSIRESIAATIEPGLVRQEMYDMSEEEIRERIRNPALFLDPQLVYRALEERYNINLFVFNPYGALNRSMAQENTDESLLEVPRCRAMHLRKYRNRPVVLILKHMGSKSNLLEMPQCELIVTTLRNTEDGTRSRSTRTATAGAGSHRDNVIINVNLKIINYIFDGDDMCEMMYECLRKSFHSIVWSFPREESRASWKGDVIDARDQPYNRLDWERLLENMEIESQHIDGYGKARAFNILTPESQLRLTLFTPPSQPMNVAVTHTIHTSALEEEVVKILGPPRARHAEGLWYSALDLPWAIFVPCIVSGPVEAEAIPDPPIYQPSTSLTANPIDTINQVQKMAAILLRLIIWAWQCDGRPNVAEWWSRFVTIGAMDRVPRPYNNLMPRRLPACTSSIQCFNAIARWWPAYFRRGASESHPKLYVYRSLYDKLRSYLLDYQRKTDGIPIVPDRQIAEMLSMESDFDTRPNAVMLIGLQSMEAWKNHFEHIQPSFHRIITQIPLELGDQREPFLYRDIASGKVYIIQNVSGSNHRTALNVATTWRRSGYNLGYDAPPISDDEVMSRISYITYSIDKHNLPSIIGDTQSSYILDPHSEEPQYYQVLRYGGSGSKRFAAMLPIL